MFLPEVVGRGLPVVLEMAHGLRCSVFGVRLQPLSKLSGEVGNLNQMMVTPGLEVVRWQKVEPVGGILGGYLDL
jgi:hypothetical protein